jgi:hypothetical protein
MMQGSNNAWNRQPSPEEAAEELAFAGAAPAPVDVNDLGW